MKISRHGTSADFGESRIQFNAPAFSWNQESSCITIKQFRVKDFSTSSRHNYTVSLSLVELQHLLQAISDAAISYPILFEKNLEPSLKHLLRIQSVIAGFVGGQIGAR